jgi:hypothetical protein
MQVTINEQRIAVDFSHLRCLEEALVELHERYLPEGHQMFQVLVNGEFFSERYPRESRYLELKDISTLDLKTISDQEMAKVLLREAGSKAQVLCRAIAESARLFRVAPEDEANHHFARLLEALRWLLQTGDLAAQVLRLKLAEVPHPQGGNIFPFLKNLQQLVEEMVEISEVQDYILLADLLEYELFPLVQEWQGILRHLADR